MDKSKIAGMVAQAFISGADYGLVLSEEERMSEEMFDGFQCFLASKKYAMPSCPAERRQIHSKKWFDAKKESVDKFNDLLKEIQEL
jgi:hypothetical protein